MNVLNALAGWQIPVLAVLLVIIGVLCAAIIVLATLILKQPHKPTAKPAATRVPVRTAERPVPEKSVEETAAVDIAEETEETAEVRPVALSEETVEETAETDKTAEETEETQPAEAAEPQPETAEEEPKPDDQNKVYAERAAVASVLTAPLSDDGEQSGEQPEETVEEPAEDSTATISPEEQEETGETEVTQEPSDTDEPGQPPESEKSEDTADITPEQLSDEVSEEAAGTQEESADSGQSEEGREETAGQEEFEVKQEETEEQSAREVPEESTAETVEEILEEHGLTSAEEITEEIAEEIMAVSVHHDEEAEEVVAVEGLYKTYSKKADYAVSDVNFRCYAGEIVGLLGHNGAGKSTTLKCLEGMLPFDKGAISICGKDILKDPISAKANMGFVTDNHATFIKMTGMQYLSFMADMYNVPDEVRKERIEKLEEVFQLGSAVDNLISSYSHGMRQKVCMMGSLMHMPKLWVLDEPMTGLDPRTTHAVQQFMREYADAGNCIIFSSHALITVARMCDRVVLLRTGHQLDELNIKRLMTVDPNFDFEEYFLKHEGQD